MLFGYTLLERIPFELRVFDSPHIVLGRVFAENRRVFEAIFRFVDKPALNVRFSYSSVDLQARFSILAIGMVRSKSKLSIQTEFALFEAGFALFGCSQEVQNLGQAATLSHGKTPWVHIFISL